jgi:SMC interacting uncharacterized protein involved in chromosome segregation
MYKKELTGKMRFLQAELYDAKMEIAEYKKRTEELENKVETQGLKIDHLEKMLDEKILESEKQKVKIVGNETPAPILKALPKISVPKENFGFKKNQLEAVSKYG